MLAQSFFIVLVHTVYLTSTIVVLNLKARTLVLLNVFFLFLVACLQPCLRISGTEWDGELGNLALMCFSVVVG